MSRIKVAIVGLGNCASALLQGVYAYRDRESSEAVGLMHWEIGGYLPGDVEVVAALDIDRRKVGRDVSEAVFASPNCTRVFHSRIPRQDVTVSMGRILDGVSDHMRGYREEDTFAPAGEPEPDEEDVARLLRESGAKVLLNYLPVGSEEATGFYAECALRAGVGMLNCIPVFLASDSGWAERFERAGLPIIGDDIKSQMGATIVHRALSDLFRDRGVELTRTYQLNTGGNTDFLNMLNRSRLASKKESKTEAVQAAAARRLEEGAIHVGPSDYVSWQQDSKTAFIRMEGRIFGDVPVSLDLKLSVEDSPNSAGCAIDAVRCLKLALERGQAGPLLGPSCCFMKHPPQLYGDRQAREWTEAFIRGEGHGR
ncbi:MAG: inositol-3-phosphate synthase [Desulfohalobiaceae bacterium]|nr:inositol-3-phosphate synthase [Desulfohalobiaceae bacterium]